MVAVTDIIRFTLILPRTFPARRLYAFHPRHYWNAQNHCVLYEV